MILFHTSQTTHIAKDLPFAKGAYTCKKSSDGEIHLELETDVNGKIVWVLGAIFPPADQTLELFFLLDALTRAGAMVNVIFTYFGYSRQDQAAPGSALSAQVICNFLITFDTKKIFIIHAHSNRLHEFLKFENTIPIPLIKSVLSECNAVAAPDKGAYDLVATLSKQCNVEPIFLSKVRSGFDAIKIIAHEGDIKDRKVLIVDDIIATGNTIVAAAQMLHEQGAQEINVWAAHGIFCSGALEAIEKSVIKKVYVTDTLCQQVLSNKIEVVSIAQLVHDIIKQNSAF